MNLRIAFLISVSLLWLSCQRGNPLPSPLNTAQVEALANEALRHTPDYKTFAEGTQFTWVYLKNPRRDAFPEVTEAIAVKLASRYRVYRPGDDLPAEYLVDGVMGLAFEGGFLYTVEVRKRTPRRIEVTFSDYESPLAASDQTIEYIWNGSKWVAIKTGKLRIS